MPSSSSTKPSQESLCTGIFFEGGGGVRQARAPPSKKTGPHFSKSASSLVWLDGRREGGRAGGTAARGCSLAEVSAQSGRAVVCPELDEGVQEVSVQVGELLTGADLLQVVGGDHQEVAQGVECVEELQHQRNLDTAEGVCHTQRHTRSLPAHVCETLIIDLVTL